MSTKPNTFSKFDRHFSKLKKEPDSIIFKEGEPGSFAYIVREGEVIISTRSDSGEIVLLTTIKPGQIFGELALLNDAPRSATAITKTGCELLVIGRAQLDPILMQAHPFLRFWIDYLAERVLELSKRVH